MTLSDSFKFISVALLAAMPAVQTYADEPNQLQWHGFANLGTIKTDHNNFFGDSQNWSWDFHDAGLGGSWKPNSKLQFSAQGIYRRAGKTSADGVQLDYALIDYSIINNFEHGLGVRLGRVKNPYGLHNETRDIAASRPSILLPQSIYYDSLRELFHTSDGISSYGHLQFSDTLLNLDLVYGQPLIDETTEAVILNVQRPGDIEHERLLLARAMLEDSAGSWRIGYSYGHMTSDYQAAPVDFSVDGEANIELNLISAEFNWQQWQLMGEFQRRNLSYKDIAYTGYKSKTDADSWYIQTGYQFHPQWKAYARYDVYYLFNDDKDGKKYTALRGLPAHEAFAKDITAGVRYTINEHWMIAAEYHDINGTAWLPRIENPDPSQTRENWHLFTAQISCKF